MIDINICYNENCLDTMKRINNNFIDLVITSPPYDNLREYHGYDFNFTIIAQELYRILKIGGVIVWIVGYSTIQGSETGTSFKQALYFKKIHFNLHDTMIYVKNSYPFPPKNRYYQQFEYMFILSKGKPKTTNLLTCDNKYKYKNKQCTQRKKDGSLTSIIVDSRNKRIMDNVWYENVGYMRTTKDKFAYQHPAMFPESLCAKHILTWSNKNDIIYDPFMGAGTTAKMCLLNERKWIGSEISLSYFNIIKKRIAEVRDGID